jgi:hypothetical protein
MKDETKEVIGTVVVMCLGLSLCALALILQGCGGVVHSPAPWQEGSILLSADEKGMRAFGDTMVGIANEARTPAGIKSSHYQLREIAVQEDTKRQLAPGFLTRLFGGAK